MMKKKFKCSIAALKFKIQSRKDLLNLSHKPQKPALSPLKVLTIIKLFY